MTPTPALFALPALLIAAALIFTPKPMKIRAAVVFITALMVSLALQISTVTYTAGVLLLLAAALLAAALTVTHALVNPLKRTLKHAGLKRRAEAHDEAHRTNFYNENPRT